MKWNPLILSFQLAGITTLILLIISVPLAYWLSITKSKFKPIVETLISMPLVLPPTVIGFYLLVAFSPNSFFGNLLNQWFGIKLAFSFSGLVVASIFYSLPFMVQPIYSGLANLPKNLTEICYILGKSKVVILFKVLLPNIKPSILTAMVLTLAHTIGEFGIVLMIGGNIPNRTRVVSIAIYDEVESLNYSLANQYSLILLVISFTFLFLVYLINGNYFNKFWK